MSNFNKIIDYLNNKYHGSDNNLKRGKAFEQYCKWFLKNDPCYASQLKNVWLWDEWPGNWGRDKGIDLVAETHCGKIWAIQAKAYEENYYITKEDVDRFLSESNRKIISYRLLIATTNNLGPNAREVIQAQEKPTGFCLLNSLENTDLDWSDALTKPDSVVKKEIRMPRPHQERALQGIIAGLEKSSYGQVHMACGTGKTLVGLWFAERLHCETTLVLVPSLSLVAQLYKEWVSFRSNSFTFSPFFVCSDETVWKKEDDVEDIKEVIANLGFPVTTNATELLEELTSTSGQKVIFSTYHSSPVIKEVCDLDSTIQFDLVVADEAHRCAGKANTDFALIVDKYAIRTKRKVFMTATPKIFSEHVKKTTEELDVELVSMDDEEKFGPVFYTLPFSQAIKEDLLSDYQVLVSVMDNKTYQEYAEKGRSVAINNQETDARMLASQLLVAKAIKHYDLKKVITFHNRTKSAQKFIQGLPDAMTLLTEKDKPVITFKDVVFSDVPQYKRDQILKQFKQQEECSILGSVKCLSEGVDVPELDGIAFIDPKRSEIDIVQAVGRVMRKPKNGIKKVGTIIIPVFLDDMTDETVALEGSCFKVVWQVIKALRVHDDILAEELDNIRLELGKRTYKRPPKLTKVVIDVPVSVNVEFGNALKLKLVENIVAYCSSAWNYQLSMLKEFRKQNPDRWPMAHELYEGNNLGSWCNEQRHMRKQGQLSKTRINSLDDIGFVWDVLRNNWQNWLGYLIKFRTIYPSQWPSKGEEFPEKKKLGSWCNQQRQDFKQGLLQDWQIEQLKNIGFVWDPLSDAWDVQLGYLMEYRKIYTEQWPEQRDEFPTGNKLGSWCGRQRQLFKSRKLSVERKNKLEALGFDFTPRESKWLPQFNRLVEFQKLNNRWPKKHEEYPLGNRLGGWCHDQRTAFKKNRLSADKIAKFHAIGLFEVIR